MQNNKKYPKIFVPSLNLPSTWVAKRRSKHLYLSSRHVNCRWHLSLILVSFFFSFLFVSLARPCQLFSDTNLDVKHLFFLKMSRRRSISDREFTRIDVLIYNLVWLKRRVPLKTSTRSINFTRDARSSLSLEECCFEMRGILRRDWKLSPSRNLVLLLKTRRQYICLFSVSCHVKINLWFAFTIS